ncbi:MAG: DJ-1/PfpI family protein [Ruminococcus sp.]|jgi:4-methyl-5(b-hydroxyethyl)-thiazole monophosphate biosynthesis|nr:DJ-1/PfpI family protein [Ruminococcus sp.]
MVYIFLADGFEEIEALAPVDILRRGGVDVKLVGITGEYISGSHGIVVRSDIQDFTPDIDTEMIILPGGMPGTRNLEASPLVQSAIDFCVKGGKYIAAICAAPSILGHKGLLSGKRATAFPGFEKDLTGAIVSADSVVTDGNIITAKGAGAALEFGFELLKVLKCKDISRKISNSMQFRK